MSSNTPDNVERDRSQKKPERSIIVPRDSNRIELDKSDANYTPNDARGWSPAKNPKDIENLISRTNRESIEYKAYLKKMADEMQEKLDQALKRNRELEDDNKTNVSTLEKIEKRRLD
ncbi:MAG: hypothetical protein M1834_009755 [Cirrosporium novae-zelandiae]|nr:MAG: hypothetical protein M1834_009755 [Cirrosporium novae-zelandiae]